MSVSGERERERGSRYILLDISELGGTNLRAHLKPGQSGGQSEGQLGGSLGSGGHGEVVFAIAVQERILAASDEELRDTCHHHASVVLHDFGRGSDSYAVCGEKKQRSGSGVSKSTQRHVQMTYARTVHVWHAGPRASAEH